ncbi:MAG: hypothetical protein ABIP85_14800 [Chthoniobacteraceae bacterium]
MIIEQYQLGVFARRVGVEVGILLPLAPTRKQVSKVGYAHLTGGAKREDKWIAKAEARLAADFPEAYERFLAEWPRLVVDSAPGGSVRDCSAAVIAAAFESRLTLARRRGPQRRFPASHFHQFARPPGSSRLAPGTHGGRRRHARDIFARSMPKHCAAAKASKVCRSGRTAVRSGSSCGGRSGATRPRCS